MLHTTALSALLVVGGSILTPLAAQTYNVLDFTWHVGRYQPESFETATEALGHRERIGVLTVGESGFPANRPEDQRGTFWNHQGVYANTGLTNADLETTGQVFISADLYVPESWRQAAGAGDDGVTGVYQAPSLWGQFSNSEGQAIGWPILGFSNINAQGSTTGKIVVWDDINGEWKDTGGTVNFGGWNNLRIIYQADDEKIFLMANDDLVYTIDLTTGCDGGPCDTEGILSRMFLSSYNNGTQGYETYWANVFTGVADDEIEEGTTHNRSVHLEGDGGVGDGTGIIHNNVTINESLQISEKRVAFGDNILIKDDLVLINNAATQGGLDTAVTVERDAFVDERSTLGGNFNIHDDLYIAGVISPGNSAGITNIAGDYTPDANGATATMEVDFGATSHQAGVTYDQINIGGDATGTTLVQLVPLEGTSLDGGIGDVSQVKLVTVAGTVDDDAFVLDRRYVMGGKEIKLVTRDEGGTTIFALDAETVAEAFGFASLPVTAAMAGDKLLGRFVDRRGFDWANAPRAWARAVGGGFDIGRKEGIGVDSSFAGGLVGLDVIALPALGHARVGIQAGYGYADAKSKPGPRISSGLDHIGTTTNTTAVGAYLTHADANYFADLTIQYRYLSMDATNGINPNKSSVDGHGIDLAGEVGYMYPLYDGVALVPTAQLVYQSLHLDKFKSEELTVKYGSEDVLIGRATVMALTAWDGVVAYGGFGVAGNLSGSLKSKIAAGETLKSKMGGARAEVVAGLQADLASGVSINVSGEYGVGFSSDVETYLGKAALQVSF
ncbi:autotransporter outer membrane beta-barrel domain-containing protein [Rhodoligotrophos defluvii]|uniref:autotransporter outer membrane beta-barrel domain-containing protein n=1 Tax=Rhodoligotrophos defluvii TaxID=2561934 RepID=UPI001485421F|nr:autotransporter outer membrane beta-barrel domain-containing protein [Rhodoligotrophos defluvii]